MTARIRFFARVVSVDGWVVTFMPASGQPIEVDLPGHDLSVGQRVECAQELGGSGRFLVR